MNGWRCVSWSLWMFCGNFRGLSNFIVIFVDYVVVTIQLEVWKNLFFKKETWILLRKFPKILISLKASTRNKPLRENCQLLNNLKKKKVWVQDENDDDLIYSVDRFCMQQNYLTWLNYVIDMTWRTNCTNLFHLL